MSEINSLQVNHLVKNYGTYAALRDVTISFREGEFFALLGPSGCGKSTLLRAMAGFVEPTSGSIMLDGKEISNLPANKRPINMMFQSYALFPHMTVLKNIRYGPEVSGVAKAEIAERVAAILDATQLTAISHRLPSELSGGQRQRVALARALVMKPRVLLLDEPLSALDRKLRESMQSELKRIQHDFGITFIVVTHDQEEALVMADRVAVMRDGQIEQIGTPLELYEQPRTRFVSEFIGNTNFLTAKISNSGFYIDGLGHIPTDDSLPAGEGCTLSIRPERITLSSEAGKGIRFRGQIVDVTYHGADRMYHLKFGDYETRLTARVSANVSGTHSFGIGDDAWVEWEASNMRALA